MENSLGNLIEIAFEYGPQGIAKRESLVALLEIAAHLPFASAFVLETSLSHDKPFPDLSTGVRPIEEEMGVWSRSKLPIASNLSLDVDRIWEAIRTFCRTTLNPKSYLHPFINTFWVEYDIPIPAQCQSAPLVFATFNELPGFWPIQEAFLLKILMEIPNRYSEPLKNTFLNSVKSLSGSGKMVGLGWMTSRGINVIRIGLRFNDFGELLDYLKRIQWEGKVSELIKQLKDLLPFANWWILNLDIGDRLHPRVGLELKMIPPHRQQRLSQLIQILVRQGICLPQKAQMLQKWNFQRPFPKGTKIENKFSNMEFGIGYIKLVVEPGKPIAAKSYTYVKCDWI